ncbi:MAG: CocE/NonD family hydrolase, partial [Candidatus Baltobacteraceae bacterium]
MKNGNVGIVARALALAMMSSLYASASPAPATQYTIDDHVLIRTTYGVTLSALVVRRSGIAAKQPTAFVFTIYAEPKKDVKRMEYAADRGYVAVTAYTRGKAYSPQAIAPYEFDGRDANSVIDWIIKQPWSNGKVGMFGGSYNGFTQWAAAKWMNPALKTIVPYVAENPGNGLPMQANVFLLVNYAWIYYVTDNKFLDDVTYNDPRWRTLNDRWYASGRAYRDVDGVAGTPNPWLRKWLMHPSYDAYWQSMVPYRSDFARINIPVLTITGYYDDGQISAMGFFKDHYAYNPRARDDLVIGPWDHFGAQRRVKDTVLRGYRIDPVAQIDTPKLTFDWLDYVMRGKPKPALVQDRINYEVMGENVWKHKPTLATMGTAQRLYLTGAKISRRFYLLSPTKPTTLTALRQRVDLQDRRTTNNDSYPDPVLGKKPNLSNGYSFLTRPFSSPEEVSGFDGTIHAIVNKRDMDIGLVLYEMMPDGKLFQLSYFTGRASYARDMSKRTLLTPG